MKHITAKIALFTILLVLVFSGCKDFFHPDGSSLRDNPGNPNPINPPGSASNPIDLSHDTMYYNNTLPAGTVHYYRIYAAADGYGWHVIFWDDSDNSSCTADIKVGVRREGSSSYVVNVTDDGNSSYEKRIEFYVSSSGYYIIEVHGYDSYSSGSYGIGYWHY